MGERYYTAERWPKIYIYFRFEITLNIHYYTFVIIIKFSKNPKNEFPTKNSTKKKKRE